jgi:hypothetical protein
MALDRVEQRLERTLVAAVCQAHGLDVIQIAVHRVAEDRVVELQLAVCREADARGGQAGDRPGRGLLGRQPGARLALPAAR